jgi:hypothetical protein
MTKHLPCLLSQSLRTALQRACSKHNERQSCDHIMRSARKSNSISWISMMSRFSDSPVKGWSADEFQYNFGQ